MDSLNLDPLNRDTLSPDTRNPDSLSSGSLNPGSLNRDRLNIHNLRCYGYTGYLPEENQLGQWFVIDLSLTLDLTAASQSDDLNDSLDYAQVIAQVSQLVKTARFKTIERLAGAIADHLLATAPQVTQLILQLTKLTPPIPDFSGQVSIRLQRQRPPQSP